MSDDAKWDDPDVTDKTVLFVMIGGRKFVPEVETDEDWMHRVYPLHSWTPDDGVTYERFCQLARAEWEATHSGLKAELAAMMGRLSSLTGKRLFEALRLAGEGGDPYMHRSIIDYEPSTGYEAVTLDAMFDLEEAARLLRDGSGETA